MSRHDGGRRPGSSGRRGRRGRERTEGASSPGRLPSVEENTRRGVDAGAERVGCGRRGERKMKTAEGRARQLTRPSAPSPTRRLALSSPNGQVFAPLLDERTTSGDALVFCFFPRRTARDPTAFPPRPIRRPPCPAVLPPPWVHWRSGLPALAAATRSRRPSAVRPLPSHRSSRGRPFPHSRACAPCPLPHPPGGPGRPTARPFDRPVPSTARPFDRLVQPAIFPPARPLAPFARIVVRPSGRRLLSPTLRLRSVASAPLARSASADSRERPMPGPTLPLCPPHARRTPSACPSPASFHLARTRSDVRAFFFCALFCCCILQTSERRR